ncbi:hypothetical protein [Gordonia sp. OPL2]|uniref:hypothetical protein n=1 Tax=Gordonia sp. OPL2 TaxID=2486274 RepID=UPI0016563187|nr:hypothetical protein [Gordonia sp. OPL2]ROZ89011.1 hypothetical protein EEB19_20090 [Gordonia sp. OPL2]
MRQPTSSEVIAALGQYLAGRNMVRYSATYEGDDPMPAFIDGLLPPDPDTVVAATIVRDDRERDLDNPDIDVRLRFRAAAGADRTADDIADVHFFVLHVPDHVVRKEVWPGGVRVLDVRRVVRAPSFQDANGRTVRADDYRITLNPKEQ